MVRLLLAVLLLGAVVVVCFAWLFPTVAPYVPFDDQTVEEPSP